MIFNILDMIPGFQTMIYALKTSLNMMTRVITSIPQFLW